MLWWQWAAGIATPALAGGFYWFARRMVKMFGREVSERVLEIVEPVTSGLGAQLVGMLGDNQRQSELWFDEIRNEGRRHAEENRQQHAEGAARMLAIEQSVAGLSGRMDTFEARLLLVEARVAESGPQHITITPPPGGTQ